MDDPNPNLEAIVGRDRPFCLPAGGPYQKWTAEEEQLIPKVGRLDVAYDVYCLRAAKKGLSIRTKTSVKLKRNRLIKQDEIERQQAKV